ncbi:MAG: extracellular solute-binding protein [Treponema sp.]|jgi:raffinose/stachyose/melibiose transport system substrate-binding protein|nr:extracellular solute-binding protein [Treponema sp.]
MKKSMLFLLGMLALAAGMVFAGGGAQQSGGGGSQDITLNFWHIEVIEQRREFLENAIKRFEQANPGVHIVPSLYENEPFKTKLKTVSGDDFPDIFRNWGGGWLKDFVNAGLAADITDYVQGVESVIGGANKNFAAFNGRIYGLPYMVSDTLLYYNKEIFEKYNLQPPTTLAELDKVAQTLLANGITPFALGNQTKWTGAQHFVYLAMRIGGPDIFQQVMDKKAKFTDEPFIRAGQILQDQVNKGYFPAGANGVNVDTGGERMMFYTGQYGMLVQLSGTLTNFRNENPDFLKKVGIIPYPVVEGGKGKITDHLAGSGVYSVSAHSKNREIAAKFVAFLASDEQFQRENLGIFQLPVRQNLSTTEPVMKEVLGILGRATYLQNFIDQTLSAALAEKHKDTTQALYAKTMTSQQVGSEMQAAIDSGL